MFALKGQPGWGRTPTPSPMVRPVAAPMLQVGSHGLMAGDVLWVNL